jgi:hypothetical protein
MESDEFVEIEAEGRTVIVAVGGGHAADHAAAQLIEYGIKLASAQSKAAGIPYRQLVVFHLTEAVTGEQLHLVERGGPRPSELVAEALPIFSVLRELAPPDMRVYLALVPPVAGSEGLGLRAAVDALVEFHQRHRFEGHMVLIGVRELHSEALDSLAERLEGSTLIPVPIAAPGAGG